MQDTSASPTDPVAKPMEPSFFVIACAVGVEAWLKAEIAREHPSLRPSFSRPGLVTFKQGAVPVEPAEVRSVFARVVSVSHGRLEGESAADFVRARRAAHAGPLRVFVHAGGARRSGKLEATPAPRRAELASEVRAATLAALRADLAGTDVALGGRAQPGERVIDLFIAPEEPTWLGEHEHAVPMQPWASGDAQVALPDDAPSRAYLKMEEAIAWAGLTVGPGQLVVEIGSAPGGASLALLRRGTTVIGVDPGAMDPIVTTFRGAEGPAFRHLQVPVGALSKTDLPRDVDWLALDVNLAPPVALRYAERIVGPRRERLRGAIFTLKMNDAEMAAKIPSLLAHVRKMGFGRVLATQLPQNRSEICVVALNPADGRGRASPARSTKPVNQAKPAKKPSTAASRRGSRAPTSK